MSRWMRTDKTRPTSPPVPWSSRKFPLITGYPWDFSARPGLISRHRSLSGWDGLTCGATRPVFVRSRLIFSSAANSIQLSVAGT